MKPFEKIKRLRLILGDQLNAQHSWFQQKESDTLYLIAELHQEATYTQHHAQKICAFFAAMEHFASALQNAGFNVMHMTLDETLPYSDLTALLTEIISRYQIAAFEYQLPDEHRLRAQLAQFCQTLAIESHSIETEHFYLSDQEIALYFKKNVSHRLEHFYRKMRTRFNLLMIDGEPEGGQWNFDKENRHKFKPDELAEIPEPLNFANNVSEIWQRIQRHNISTIGKVQESLLWPVNRKQASDLLHYFCRYCLAKFGKFQDAMTGSLQCFDQDRGWSLYHSRLSFALNTKMLSPQYVVDTAIDYYRNSNCNISIAQIEGFTRQILGWREFVRGIYWANIPDYSTLNHLNAAQALPSWFWTGDTKMRCLSHAISQSLDFAYAHHIQRLMVTGNFCLIAGINPDQVDQWYLGIYIDAIEWVEMPNTRGMSQFADGGIVGSKAYAGSGSYINRMSDYCRDCHYQVTESYGESACPLNALYWHFMVRHQEKFSANPRNRMVYANWQKKSKQDQELILKTAQKRLAQLSSL